MSQVFGLLTEGFWEETFELVSGELLSCLESLCTDVLSQVQHHEECHTLCLGGGHGRQKAPSHAMFTIFLVSKSSYAIPRKGNSC